ncbi:uncharacterized protein BJX67DRAFT_209627 [Aspergillus lucknowensis]|uniref:Uncharacterized protein n=1 Tax=Aspergillus lucknowensis TaxID=176173 RepID=A0ABR4LMJ8_9EURO
MGEVELQKTLLLLASLSDTSSGPDLRQASVSLRTWPDLDRPAHIARISHPGDTDARILTRYSLTRYRDKGSIFSEDGARLVWWVV